MTTDPTTLRTALEALIADGIEAFRLTREYVGDDVLPDEPGWSWFDWAQRARAALATPAPAADEARCEVCGEPTAMGQGLIVIDGKRQHQTCYMGIDQPAPTPVPPTPPATGTVERCAAGVEAVHAGIPTVVTCGEPRDSEAHEAGAPDFDHLFVAPVLVANPAPTPEPSPSAALVERAAQALHRWLGRRGGPHGKHWRYENCILSDVDTEGGKFIATFLAADLALAARSAGSGSRVERECVCGHGWADHGLTGGCEAEWGTGDGDVFCPCTHTRPTPPPAGATQVPLPATDSTPPPAVDGTRCAECGGVKDDVFHVPCLVGGPFHYVKTCHPFTPPAPEPSAALVEELLRRIEESGHCRWCYVVTRADLDIIVAAAYREPRGPR